MTILAQTYFCRQKPIFASKNYFASPVFTMEKWKNCFFPPSGKNLPSLPSINGSNHLSPYLSNTEKKTRND